MLSAADWTAMTADLAAVRGDNPLSIVIRRGTSTLAAQTVRIARQGASGQQAQGQWTEEGRGRVLVAGPPTLDIQPEDRFNDGSGALYRVVVVRPNRRASTVAEAELVQ